MTQPPPIMPGPSEPYTLAAVMPEPTKPPRPGWVVPVIVGLVVLLLVMGGVVAWALTRAAGVSDETPAAAVPGPTPTRTTVASLTAKEACTRAINLTNDALTQVMNALTGSSDGSTVDRAKLRTIIDGLQEIRPSMPGTLGDDVTDILEPLEHLQQVLDGRSSNPTINFEKFRSRGPGLIIACGAYLK